MKVLRACLPEAPVPEGLPDESVPVAVAEAAVPPVPVALALPPNSQHWSVSVWLGMLKMPGKLTW